MKLDFGLIRKALCRRFYGLIESFVSNSLPVKSSLYYSINLWYIYFPKNWLSNRLSNLRRPLLRCLIWAASREHFRSGAALETNQSESHQWPLADHSELRALKAFSAGACGAVLHLCLQRWSCGLHRELDPNRIELNRSLLFERLHRCWTQVHRIGKMNLFFNFLKQTVFLWLIVNLKINLCELGGHCSPFNVYPFCHTLSL